MTVLIYDKIMLWKLLEKNVNINTFVYFYLKEITYIVLILL